MRFCYVVGVPALSRDFDLSRVPHVWPQKLHKKELFQCDAVIALPSWTHSKHLIEQVHLAIDYGKQIFYLKTVADVTKVGEWAVGDEGIV